MFVCIVPAEGAHEVIEPYFASITVVKQFA